MNNNYSLYKMIENILEQENSLNFNNNIIKNNYLIENYTNNYNNNFLFSNNYNNFLLNNYDKPFLKYIRKSKYKDIYNPINDVCPISHTNFNYDSDIIQINFCKHIFSENKILEWFEINHTCPVCRYNISNNIN